MLVVLASLGVSAFTAPGAQAGSQVFISAQYVGDSGVFGYVDPLYRVTALAAGYNACINALTYPNGPWAGTTYCGNSPDHPYNSSNRWGWSGAAPGTVEDIYATEYW
jgi:hypothetical protein